MIIARCLQIFELRYVRKYTAQWRLGIRFSIFCTRNWAHHRREKLYIVRVSAWSDYEFGYDPKLKTHHRVHLRNHEYIETFPCHCVTNVALFIIHLWFPLKCFCFSSIRDPLKREINMSFLKRIYALAVKPQVSSMKYYWQLHRTSYFITKYSIKYYIFSCK